MTKHLCNSQIRPVLNLESHVCVVLLVSSFLSLPFDILTDKSEYAPALSQVSYLHTVLAWISWEVTFQIVRLENREHQVNKREMTLTEREGIGREPRSWRASTPVCCCCCCWSTVAGRLQVKEGRLWVCVFSTGIHVRDSCDCIWWM